MAKRPSELVIIGGGFSGCCFAVNFLFMDDGHIGVLDLGCTRELSPAFRRGVYQAWMVEPLRHEVFDFAQLPPAPLPSEDDQKVLARTMAGIHAELPSFDRAWIGTLHILRQLGARVRTAGDSSLTEFSGRES